MTNGFLPRILFLISLPLTPYTAIVNVLCYTSGGNQVHNNDILGNNLNGSESRVEEE